ncbi:MAG: UDP-N-acetylmuramoyl-tripeptide--D-alanyl-D-alanine ligase, partial [Gemmatimonadetes bacterium]|nr:UDP-N-acetylmuramoyl-tripeptide--D-alanyl-D-alanine ligase [Gemmatimonadota bacterium]
MSFRWTDAEVRAALGMPRGEGIRDAVYSRVSTDSRTVEASDLFVALDGDRFDGHDFVLAALERGAAGAVVSRDVVSDPDPRFYAVPDTLVALGDLARHRRKSLSAKVVGITGSSGKTTTKDLLAEALGGTLSVHQTKGNLNNRIGLPLTILATPAAVDVLVLEMGTNEPGEIGSLTHIAGPHVGVITTVSEAHLEKLGSLRGVMEEKLDLLKGLPADGLAVVGDEPPELEIEARALVPSVVVSGWSGRALPENRPESPVVGDNGCFRFRWRGEKVELSLPGRHSVTNALLALAVAEALGVPPGDAARGVGSVKPGGMRGEVRSLGGLTLLVDCYNANPQSLRAALELLST